MSLIRGEITSANSLKTCTGMWSVLQESLVNTGKRSILSQLNSGLPSININGFNKVLEVIFYLKSPYNLDHAFDK